MSGVIVSTFGGSSRVYSSLSGDMVSDEPQNLIYGRNSLQIPSNTLDRLLKLVSYRSLFRFELRKVLVFKNHYHT